MVGTIPPGVECSDNTTLRESGAHIQTVHSGLPIPTLVIPVVYTGVSQWISLVRRAHYIRSR